jgi:hypothetical protein
VYGNPAYEAFPCVHPSPIRVSVPLLLRPHVQDPGYLCPNNALMPTKGFRPAPRTQSRGRSSTSSDARPLAPHCRPVEFRAGPVGSLAVQRGNGAGYSPVDGANGETARRRDVARPTLPCGDIGLMHQAACQAVRGAFPPTKTPPLWLRPDRVLPLGSNRAFPGHWRCKVGVVPAR